MSACWTPVRILIAAQLVWTNIADYIGGLNNMVPDPELQSVIDQFEKGIIHLVAVSRTGNDRDAYELMYMEVKAIQDRAEQLGRMLQEKIRESE